MLTHALLYAGLLPLVASASIGFIMRQLRCPPQIAWPIATTAGFLAAQFTLRSQSGFSESLRTFLQPHESVDWLPHIVLLALGVSIVMYLAPHRRPLIALAAALCVAAPIRLLSGNVAQHLSVIPKVAVLVSLAAAFGIVWLLLSLSDNEQPAVLHMPLLVLVAVGTTIVVTQSGALVYGLLSAALGAAVAGTAIAFLDATGSALESSGATRSASASERLAHHGASGASGIITFTLGSLIILGHFYAELSAANATLLFLSLTATSAPLPALLRSCPTWQRNAVRVILCVLPLAIAVISVV